MPKRASLDSLCTALSLRTYGCTVYYYVLYWYYTDHCSLYYALRAILPSKTRPLVSLAASPPVGSRSEAKLLYRLVWSCG